MSYKKLLTHRCDVYHLKERNVGGGGNWGVPDDDFQKEFYYDDEPDLSNIRCYFTEKNQSIIQLEPNNNIMQSFLFFFIPKVVIRKKNKKKRGGGTQKNKKPPMINKHHQEVTVVRDDNL